MQIFQVRIKIRIINIYFLGNNPISFKGLNQNASQLPTQP